MNNNYQIKSIDEKKSKFILLILAEVFYFLLFTATPIQSKSNDTIYIQVLSDIENTQASDFTIIEGSQYAFMSDEWNVYIAKAISETIIKIEHWDKLHSSDEKMKFREDLGVFKINDPQNGFSWIDNDNLTFTFNLQDKDNSRFKKPTKVVFTISISESDICKGSNYNSKIVSYAYKNDDWHLYRAIPLSDNFIKIEAWSRGNSNDNFLYGYDVAIINPSYSAIDFEWTNEKHVAFTITMQDTFNKYYWKKPAFVGFFQENENNEYPNVMAFLENRHSNDNENKLPLDLYVSMPNLLLLDLETAKKGLKSEGFGNVTGQAYDGSLIWNDYKWTVIGQNIPSDSEIDKNDEIILICKPTDAFLNENFLGKTIYDAISIAEELFYNLKFTNSVTDISLTRSIANMDEKEQKLWIIDKTTMEDIRIRNVLLEVHYIGKVMMPNVTGLSLDQALDILCDNNFSNVKYEAQDGSLIWNNDKWKVINQSELEGTFITATEEISLVCISYTSEQTATAKAEANNVTSTPEPTNTSIISPTETLPLPIETINTEPSADTDEEVLSGLRDYAKKAIIVAFTNMDSLDVFTSDGNYYDPSKFHNYSYDGEYRYTVTDEGTWTAKSPNTYHVENMYLLMRSMNHAVKLIADVSFENHQYVLSNVSYISASPKYIDTTDPSKTSGWIPLQPDSNIYLTVPSSLVGGEPFYDEISIGTQPLQSEILGDGTGTVNNLADIGIIMYSQPSLSGDIMMFLKNGTQVKIITIPRVEEGYRWIKIRTTEGYEGWVFESGVTEN